MKQAFYTSTLLLLIALSTGCRNNQEDPITPIEPEDPVSPVIEAGIPDIKQFLDTCPESDPYFTEIQDDFDIRLNGEKITTIKCESPVSEMEISNFQTPLILLQSLRVIRHMETGPLPWTNETLYDWIKNAIGGIDIQDGISAGGFCCMVFDNENFIVVKNLDEFNRGFKKQWIGISSTIDLIVHEVRHLSGPSHNSCCGIPNGCDQVYDLDHLSSYGTQLWLNRRWLSNEIDMGLSSYSAQEKAEMDRWFASAVRGFENRFCE